MAERSRTALKTKIKICGLKRPEDAAIVNRLRPDYVGFVFAGTKRKIAKETAAALRAAIRPEILSVGVFVNEPMENIAVMCREGILDLVQLHGDETEAYVAEVKRQTQKPVIRAVRVRSQDDVLANADSCADYLLFDTYRAGEYGGSGAVFAWDDLLAAKKRYEENRAAFPAFFMAGGLNAGNAPNAIRTLHPYALDISSGVETDGFKDEEKIKEFLKACRNADGMEGK